MTDMNIRQRAKWRRERVAALVAEGLEDAAIAERLGISKGRVGTFRREAGVTLPPHGALDDEVVRKLHSMHDEGCPPGEIAKTLGIHYDTVYRRLGPSPTGAEWNAVARWASKNYPKLWEELRP